MTSTDTPPPRAPLSTERVLAAAIALADADGLDALSMRTLAERLGVVPMALYKHVRNKDELLDLMVESIVAALPAAEASTPSTWQRVARERILATRAAMLAHPWAWQAIETRTLPGPAALDHMEAMIQTLRGGGLSVPLVHHVMHALSSRLWGFTQEVFASPAPPDDPAARAAAAEMLAARWPGILESAAGAAHSADSTVGPGCDDEAEFAFAIDLILDGAARLHERGWTP